jgi:hypothetical protein
MKIKDREKISTSDDDIQRTGGPTIEEFLRYCELKDGFSRSAQLAIFAVWVVFVIVAVPIVLLMSP